LRENGSLRQSLNAFAIAGGTTTQGHRRPTPQAYRHWTAVEST
jgi:hypothetical protein